jgi:hypothetical protein
MNKNESNTKVRRNTFNNDKNMSIEKRKNLYKNKYRNLLSDSLIKKLQNPNDHIIIYVINSIFLSFVHVAMINFNTLNSIRSVDSKMLLNEYRKRYENYSDCAIYIDKELRSLSIIINKLFDECKLIINECPDFSLKMNKINSNTIKLNKKISSKINETETSSSNISFSVLKLIVSFYFNYKKSVWHREVLTKLVDKNNKFIIISKIGEIFKKMLSNRIVIELEPILKEKLNSYFFLYDDNYDKDKSVHNAKDLKEYMYKNDLIHMLETLISGLHDVSINEYSVFLLNHSEKIKHTTITKEILNELCLQLSWVLDFFMSTYYECDKVEIFKSIIEFFINFQKRSNLFPHYKKELIKTFCTKMCELFVKEMTLSNEKIKKLNYKFSYNDNNNSKINDSFNNNMMMNINDFSKLNSINYDAIDTYTNENDFNVNQISDTFTSYLSLNEDKNFQNISNTVRSINESFPYFIDNRCYDNKKFNSELSKSLMNFIYSKGELPELHVKSNLDLCIECFNILREWVEEKEFSMNYVNSQIEKSIKNSKLNYSLLEDELQYICPVLSL